MLGGGLNSLIPPRQNEFGEGQASGKPEENKNQKPEQPEAVLAPEEFFQDLKQEIKAPGAEKVSEEFDFNPHKHTLHKKPLVNQAIFLIEVDKIKSNPFQPRKNFDENALKELASSIREYGILQPLIVSKTESDTDYGTAVEYQLIAGERRLMASKMLGLERVPVIVRQVDQKSQHLEMAVIENLQRENLDAIETARAYARLQDEFGLTQREIAGRLGKSREVVANTLRLLSLPMEYQTAVSKNQISESQARLLLSIDNPLAQKQLFEEITVNNLTVREARIMANKFKNRQIEAKPISANDMEMKSLEEKLKEVLGAEVKIVAGSSPLGSKKGEAGKIVITFYSPEEIYGLIHKINPHNGSGGF